MEERERPIGVFDSGVGGISTLAAMVARLPKERFLYFGDTRNAPYGTKTTEEVIACARQVVAELEKDRIKALVIACNPATGAAAATLRAELALPVIAMEPALKPAHEAARGGKVLVMATPLTLRQDKFLHLMELYGENAEPVACEGLMELVEEEDEAGSEAYLKRLFSRWDPEEVDAVVLGCTHYVFLRPMIRRMLPEHILITDGNEGTARQLERVLRERGLLRERGKGETVLKTSGDPATTLPVMERLLERAQKTLGYAAFPAKPSFSGQ